MDAALVETGNGGDLKIINNDLAPQGGWGNMVYMGMFAGNYEASTRNRVPAEEMKDYWAHALLLPQDSSKQLNSLTERTLASTPLNSAGRVLIEQAVKEDLKFMSAFAVVTVKVTIVSDDKVNILVRVQQPDNGSSAVYREYIFIWDATKQELNGDFSLFDFNDDFFVQ